MIFAAIPNMVNTFDKDRDGPTPFEHHLAEFHDPHAVERSFLEHAMERNIKEAAEFPDRRMSRDEAAAFLKTPGAPGLHLHTYTAESIYELILNAKAKAGIPVTHLAASRSNPTECIAIIQRTPA